MTILSDKVHVRRQCRLKNECAKWKRWCLGFGIYTYTFFCLFFQRLYSVLILGWFSKWNTHFGWEGFMCNSGTPSSFLSGERHLVSALCLLIVLWFVRCTRLSCEISIKNKPDNTPDPKQSPNVGTPRADYPMPVWKIRVCCPSKCLSLWGTGLIKFVPKSTNRFVWGGKGSLLSLTINLSIHMQSKH